MGAVIITSIVAFTVIILLLVFILLFAQSKLCSVRRCKHHYQWDN